jgi:thiol:disulfide interchange protein DsbD
MELTGNLSDYWVAFFSGVLVSFTPCIYPLLPITASFIADINAEERRFHGFLLSMLYVFGLAITYSLLAVIAALSGQVFGQIQNNHWIYFVVANILLFFALVMADVISIPNLGLGLHQHIKAKNYWTIILFGAASGLVVGPCTAPVLGALLLYVASKQNILNGVGLLFVFSYGMGISLILVGTFSGLLASLPKSGQWLLWIKKFCALVFIIMAEYFFIQAGRIWP